MNLIKGWRRCELGHGRSRFVRGCSHVCARGQGRRAVMCQLLAVREADAAVLEPLTESVPQCVEIHHMAAYVHDWDARSR
jgi:hypothetical protein